MRGGELKNGQVYDKCGNIAVCNENNGYVVNMNSGKQSADIERSLIPQAGAMLYLRDMPIVLIFVLGF